MKTKLTSRLALFVLPIVVGVLALAPVLAATPAASARKSPLQNIPVTGTINSIPFQGTLDIVSFQPNAAGTGLVATGLLDGRYGTQTVSDLLIQGIPVTLPTADNPSAPNRTCAILDLSLGPLDLNLLGLVIHLDEVNLTIDAVSGPGNLLGNLLCAIVHLLDGGLPLGDILGQISDLLNRIIDLLG